MTVRGASPARIGTILLTGCSSGIGRALALECARRGHAVVATARRVETLEALRGEGIRTETLDVCDADGIAALAQRLAGDGVAVGMLVNNAGYGAIGPITDLAPSEIARQFEVNVFGLLAATRAFVPGMIARRRGRIVNVGSVVGTLVTPFGGAYSASKFAVRALSDAMRLELRPFGIRVTELRPGAIRSSFGDTASAVASGSVPDGSPFVPMRDTVAERARLSQRHAMPTEAFATHVADRLLLRSPPAVVQAGPFSTVGPLLGTFVPTGVRDRLLRRMFSVG